MDLMVFLQAMALCAAVMAAIAIVGGGALKLSEKLSRSPSARSRGLGTVVVAAAVVGIVAIIWVAFGDAGPVDDGPFYRGRL
jgi:hypothetical protein